MRCVGAMTSVEKLRKQAAKARRLAAGLSDQRARDALIAYAEEAEANADVLAAREADLSRRDEKP